MNKQNNEQNSEQSSDILENSQAYKQGEIVGNMCISQALFQKQINLNTEMVKQTGLLNKDFTALGE